MNNYDGIDVPPPALPVTGSFNDGFVLGVARGRQLNNCTRIEREWTWRNNTGDVWTDPTGAASNIDGQFNNFSSMVNIVRDIRNCYIGGGIGVSRQDADFIANGTQFNIEDWAFAYQGFAGINLIKHCNREMFVEYRYFANTETDLDANNVFFDNFNYEAHNVVFGFRFKR